MPPASSDASVIAENVTVWPNRPIEGSLHSLLNFVFRRAGDVEKAVLDGVSFSLPVGRGILIDGNKTHRMALNRLIVEQQPPARGMVKILGAMADLQKNGLVLDIASSVRNNIIEYYREKRLSQRGLSEAAFETAVVGLAGLPKSLKTSVERLSTGMRLRLSIALNLESKPDILCIAKIPSVLDGEFENAMVERILQIKSQGCTLLFFEEAMDMVLVDDVLDLRQPTGQRAVMPVAAYAKRLVDEGTRLKITGQPIAPSISDGSTNIQECLIDEQRFIIIEADISQASHVGFPYVDVCYAGGETVTIENDTLINREASVLVAKLPVSKFENGHYTVRLGICSDANKVKEDLISAEITVNRRGLARFTHAGDIVWSFV